MSDEFLDDLFAHCMESVRWPPDDPEARAAAKRCLVMEEAMTQAMGYEFVSEYEQVCLDTTTWQEKAAFRQGLRLGARLMLETLSAP